MIDLLLDTNIVIYLINGDKKYVSFMRQFEEKQSGVSVITYMETLIGAYEAPYEQEIQEFFGKTEIIPLNVAIAQKSAAWLQGSTHKSLRHPRLADVVIGQTALALGVPLVTNNPKDFVSMNGLKVIAP